MGENTVLRSLGEKIPYKVSSVLLQIFFSLLGNSDKYVVLLSIVRMHWSGNKVREVGATLLNTISKNLIMTCLDGPGGSFFFLSPFGVLAER